MSTGQRQPGTANVEIRDREMVGNKLFLTSMLVIDTKNKKFAIKKL
jgi:hypothetical protein